MLIERRLAKAHLDHQLSDRIAERWQKLVGKRQCRSAVWVQGTRRAMPHLGHDHVRRDAALQLVGAGVPQGVWCGLLAPTWTECRSQSIEDFSDDRVSYGSAIIADAVGEEQIPLVSGVRNDRRVVREVRPELFGDLR